MSRPAQDLLARSKQLNQRIDLIEEKLQRIREEHPSIEISALGLLDSFFFYCALLASTDKWCDSELPSLSILDRKLAPTSLLTEQVYLRLYSRRILFPSLYSPISAFNVSSPVEAPVKFDCARVHWTIASGLYNDEKFELLSMLRRSFTEKMGATVTALSFALIQHECMAMFSRSLEKLSVVVRKADEADLSVFFEDLLKRTSAADLVYSMDLILSDPTVKEKISRTDLRKHSSRLLWDLVRTLDETSIDASKLRTYKASKKSLIRDSDCVLSTEFARSFPHAI